MSRPYLPLTAGFLVLLLAACENQPAAPPEEPTEHQLLAAIRCQADAAAGSIRCEDLSSSGVRAGNGLSPALVTVGAQHRYVRLQNSGTAYEAGSDVLSTTVTIQNLLWTAMATGDGSTPHADGVRIFFDTGPTNGVTVGNPDGTGIFTASGQEYFAYSGADLGADGILSPAEQSSGKLWSFDMNGAGSFQFTVYVQARVRSDRVVAAHLGRIDAGGEHTCALDDEGRAYCWGQDASGQLGNGLDTPNHSSMVPSHVNMPASASFVQIAAGYNHTCALTTVGTIYCWGSDARGQLGNGSAVTGRQYAPYAVQMPPGVTFGEVRSGVEHTCGLDSEGAAHCWGADDDGRLGNGAGGTSTTPSTVLMPDGVSFTMLTAGSGHSCALGSEGDGYCWGSDTDGQLGNGPGVAGAQSPSAVQMPANVQFTVISAGDAHTCALGQDGIAYCWGSDEVGQLGNGAGDLAQQAPSPVSMPPGVTFTSLEAGWNHTCALGSDGETYCWGYDAKGQLGDGSPFATAPAPVTVARPPGVTFLAISGGAAHTCAVTTDASYCWGYGFTGAVGDGSVYDRAAPVAVAGSR